MNSITLKNIRKYPLLITSLVIMTVMIAIALIGYFTLSEDPNYINLSYINRRPSRQFWAGTDGRGRNRIVGLILGLGNSLRVAFLSAGLSTFLGMGLGALGGFFGGAWDRVVLWFIDLMGIVPSFVFSLAVFSIFYEPGIFEIGLIISLFSWPQVARLIRSKVMKEREMDYVHASITLGTGKWKILWGQVLPQVYPILIAGFFMNLVFSIGVETSISYLGFGFPLGTPSIGGMIAGAGNLTFLLHRPWLWAWPAGSVFLFMLCAHHVGQFLIRLSSPELQK